MENRINKIAIINNNDKYFIVNQANYKNRVFLLVNKLTNNEEFTEDFAILEEIKLENEITMVKVTDSEILKIIINAFSN